MRRTVQIKSLAPSTPVRKAPITATAAARKPYPAWIDANERIAAFPATVVTPRVRDGLVLRLVSKGRPGSAKGLNDGTSKR